MLLSLAPPRSIFCYVFCIEPSYNRQRFVIPIPCARCLQTSGCNTKLPSCSSFKPPSGPVTHSPEPTPLPGPSDALNLNGKYMLSETAKSAANENFPTNYRDYPGKLALFRCSIAAAYFFGLSTGVYRRVFNYCGNSNPDL